MSDSLKTTALRLAENTWADWFTQPTPDHLQEVAAELRRQHEELERKSDAIQRLWDERDKLRAKVEQEGIEKDRLLASINRDREVMRQALGALEKINAHPASFWDCADDISALRARLEAKP